MIVIIHGWSDSYKSFISLRDFLQKKYGASVTLISLADYITLDDNVTFDDLSEAMNAAWIDKKIPTKKRSVDIIAHSTGGLVVRHWLTKYFEPDNNPVFKMLMLAPANFGSPIAHKGRSFIGRAIKGFQLNAKMFQTGELILRGLEMASPFSWKLSEKDLFSNDQWYGANKILCTVIVGTEGYDGISSIANQNGTDGTVAVSTANLNSKHISLDFSKNPQVPTFKVRPSNAEIAFARIPDENHQTIAGKGRSGLSPAVEGFINKALTVNDGNLSNHIQNLANYSISARTKASNDFNEPYCNVVIHLTDHYGSDINDYIIEFYAKRGDRRVNDSLTRIIQEKIISKVHTYNTNASYRSIMINMHELEEHIISKKENLYISVTALPDFKVTKTVGYSTFGFNDIGCLKITPTDIKSLFSPDETVLVDVVIRRVQEKGVFKFM